MTKTLSLRNHKSQDMINDALQDLYFSEHASGAGVTKVAAYQLWSEPHEDPSWKVTETDQHYMFQAAC